MRAIVLTLGIALVAVVHGQQNLIGLSGGPSLCRLHGNTVFKQVDPIAGYQFGAYYTHWSKRGIGVHAQVNYARMGGALDFIGLDGSGDETYRDQIRYRFDHIGLALGAAYRTRGRVYGQLQLGLMPSVVVAAEVRSPAGFNDPGNRVITDLSDKVNNLILFGYGAFGGAVDLKAPISVGLLVRYDQGLVTLSRSDFFAVENIVETSWTVSLSLAYRWPYGN